MPELNDRQKTALKTIRDNPGCTAKAVAEAIQPGSDSRGAAQTLRRIPQYVFRSAGGEYTLTGDGELAARGL